MNVKVYSYTLQQNATRYRVNNHKSKVDVTLVLVLNENLLTQTGLYLPISQRCWLQLDI